jgi:hypothetical protein
MKISTRRLFLFSAIVLGLAAAQAGRAHVESVEGPYTISGTVAYAWGDRLAIACGYEIDPDFSGGCPLVVSGMGPAAWWSVNEVTFPLTGQAVVLDIYRVTTALGNTKYVAGGVIDNGEGEGLVLRIPVYEGDVIFVLDPAWNSIEPLAEAAALSGAPADDAECTCECFCKGEECSCDCSCESAGCDECTPMGDEHKWRGER